MCSVHNLRHTHTHTYTPAPARTHALTQDVSAVQASRDQRTLSLLLWLYDSVSGTRELSISSAPTPPFLIMHAFFALLAPITVRALLPLSCHAMLCLLLGPPLVFSALFMLSCVGVLLLPRPVTPATPANVRLVPLSRVTTPCSSNPYPLLSWMPFSASLGPASASLLGRP